MLQKPRGTQDLYDLEASLYEDIINKCIDVVKKWNYKYIKTPIFEDKELFLRSIGKDTDIVHKELFFLKSHDDLDNYALRPEGTASITRAIMENKLFQNNLLKYFYFGPMFRYERPQKGRYREFSQFGIEAIGSNSYLLDVEVILISYQILKAFDIKNINLKINCLGLMADRKKYIKDLKIYLEKYKNLLCKDCQKRLLINPLRILDCKLEPKHEFWSQLPNLYDYINPISKANFQKILNILKNNNITYEISNKLVRGLDYYEDTIFEFEAIEGLGESQATLIGGGRYNNLSTALANTTAIPSIGFAMGIERLMIFLKFQNYQVTSTNLDCFFISLSENVETELYKIWQEFTNNNLICSRTFNNNFKNQSIKANKEHAKYLIILGDNDLNNHTFTLQNNLTSEKKIIKLTDIHIAINEIKGSK